MTQPLQPNQSEEGDQILLVNWFNRNYPEHRHKLHHSPNGGYRDRRTGQRMKLMGTKAGFPDLVLYHRIGDFTGLAIELKTETGSLRQSQSQWLETLDACGFMAVTCRGLEAGQQTVRDFLGEAP